MFLVFYPIDVLILDKDKIIVEIKRNFKPFTFWNAQKKGKYVVELAYPNKYKSKSNKYENELNEYKAKDYKINDYLEF